MPGYVPTHIFHETARLRCLAMAAVNAKHEFLLTNADLQELPHVDRKRCAAKRQAAYFW